MKYKVEVMDGFAVETNDGWRMPVLQSEHFFDNYAEAKAFYRKIKAEGKRAVYFYRNGKIVFFAGK